MQATFDQNENNKKNLRALVRVKGSWGCLSSFQAIALHKQWWVVYVRYILSFYLPFFIGHFSLFNIITASAVAFSTNTHVHRHILA